VIGVLAGDDARKAQAEIDKLVNAMKRLGRR
jgi:hypothetical protein